MTQLTKKSDTGITEYDLPVICVLSGTVLDKTLLLFSFLSNFPDRPHKTFALVS
jgi:hypothetical protein